MKLLNPLESLTWNSLFRSSRSRLRRRLPSFAPMSLAAEVLEERQLLSGTVNVQQVGSALILTADANGSAGSSPTFELYRSGGTVIVDDDGSGTTIFKNGGSAGSSQSFSIANVSTVTVNLGTGYDTFYMYDLSTTGSVTINGKSAASGGAVGADVEIYTDSSAVTIGGSIIANLGQQNSDDSYFYVYTNGGNLTVNGSINVTEKGAAYFETYVRSNWSDGGGDLLVKGSILLSESGSGDKYNTVNAYYPSNLTVNGSVTLTRTDAGTGYMELRIWTDDDNSTMLIKGSVIFTDLLGKGHDYFYINTDDYENSSITINGNVTFNNSLNTNAHDDVEIYGSVDDNAGVLIKGNLTLLLSKDSSTADDSEGDDYNYVYLGEDDSEGGGYGLVVNGLTTITGGNGQDWYQIIEARFNGLVTINTMGNPAASGFNDYIEVDGSLFAGLVTTVTMNGPGAVLSINNKSEVLDSPDVFQPAQPNGFIKDQYTPHQTTEFKGIVHVFMNGPGASIHVADDSPGSSTLVAFDSLVTVVGGVGGFPAGTLYVKPSNVSFKFPVFPINFGYVLVSDSPPV